MPTIYYVKRLQDGDNAYGYGVLLTHIINDDIINCIIKCALKMCRKKIPYMYYDARSCSKLS